MAQDDNYKEGVDFEWVLMKNQPKGGTNKTRRFFTKAEKDAMKAPKADAKPKAADTKTSPKPKARPKAAPKVNGVRPEGKPAGMPAERKKTAADAQFPRKPEAKPFILGRFGPLANAGPTATAKSTAKNPNKTKAEAITSGAPKARPKPATMPKPPASNRTTKPAPMPTPPASNRKPKSPPTMNNGYKAQKLKGKK